MESRVHHAFITACYCSADDRGQRNHRRRHSCTRTGERFKQAAAVVGAGMEMDRVRKEEWVGVPAARWDLSHTGRHRLRDVMVHWAAERTTRSEEHTSELQSHSDLVCRLLLEKKKK